MGSWGWVEAWWRSWHTIGHLIDVEPIDAREAETAGRQGIDSQVQEAFGQPQVRVVRHDVIRCACRSIVKEHILGIVRPHEDANDPIGWGKPIDIKHRMKDHAPRSVDDDVVVTAENRCVWRSGRKGDIRPVDATVGRELGVSQIAGGKDQARIVRRRRLGQSVAQRAIGSGISVVTPDDQQAGSTVELGIDADDSRCRFAAAAERQSMWARRVVIDLGIDPLTEFQLSQESLQLTR